MKKKNKNAISENFSEKLQMAAVKENGYCIQYMKNPSKAVQLAAVRQAGMAIQYIDNPCDEVKLEAVKQDGYAIQLMRDSFDSVPEDSPKPRLLNDDYDEHKGPQIVMRKIRDADIERLQMGLGDSDG
jgi:hypothetical protein